MEESRKPTKAVNVRDVLTERKKQIEKALKAIEPLRKELSEIQIALDAMEKISNPDKLCFGCYDGCVECRTGMQYR